KRISRNGPQELYALETASRLERAVRKQGGLVSAADLARHETLWQEPIAQPFLGYDIATAPPNSWGLALLMMLPEIEGVVVRETRSLARLLGEMRAWRNAARAAERLIAEPSLAEAPARDALQRLSKPGKANRAAGPGSVALSGVDTTCVLAMDRNGNA